MRILAGMALLALGCGGGDFAPRVNEATVGEDAGPHGAGGMQLAAAGGHDTTGFGTGGAPPTGGSASAGAAGYRMLGAQIWPPPPCATDADCWTLMLDTHPARCHLDRHPDGDEGGALLRGPWAANPDS